MADSLRVVVDDGDDQTILVDPETGDVTRMQPDGGAVVQFGAKKAGLGDDKEEKWFDNLASKLDGTKLSVITNDLIAGIKADDESRSGWLANTARGLDIFGLKLEVPGDGTSPTGDGPVMSKVRNPLLAEACLKGWANAEAELLPANGPVKIKSDGRETNQEDDDAECLERGVNHYLTVTATEYYPETSHMLLWGTYFTGSGFKKVYRCPRRRRPVSEMVEAKDLIVSDTSKDLRSCGRITHQISMRPSIFKLMQFIGAYRATAGTAPNPESNLVDDKIAGIQGTQPTQERPEDKPYTIWETQCELDLDEFIPNGSQFKGKGIPLPYLVTIDKDNEEVLSLRRDWAEEDEHCGRKRMYVRYPYVPGPGFYGTGMLNLLGNASMAMTAAWREALDAGMFANFPGGIISKLGGRQNNTDFKPGPGEFSPVETNNMDIGKVIMPWPYRDVTPGLLSLIDKITEQSKALGQGAEIPAAEGIANVPVGTMLAQIEQATKVMAAAHKGMHTAQSEEIQMLVDIFRRHPDDLLESTKEELPGWDHDRLLQALDNVKLVPVSDPNVPSHIHRVAKALGLVQLSAMPQFASKMDTTEVLRRVLAAMREDPIGLLIENPQPQPPPLADAAKMLGEQTKAKKVDADIAGKNTENALKMEELKSTMAGKEMDYKTEQVIHAADAQKAQLDVAKVQADVQGKHAESAQKEIDSKRKTGLGLIEAGINAHDQDHQHQMDRAGHQLETTKVGIGAAESQRDHELGVAEHATNAQNQSRKSDVEEHKALHPPKPGGEKPKGGKK